MKIIGCCLGLLLTISTPVTAQTYRALYEHDTGETPVAVRHLSDGSTAILSWFNRDITIHTSVMRLDLFGNILWHHEWSASGYEFPSDIIETSDGHLAIVGLSDAFPWIQKIRLDDGTESWSKTLNRNGQFHSVAEDSNGMLVAVGADWSQGDALVADFDLDGNLGQTSAYGIPNGNDTAFDIVAEENGIVTIVGQTQERDQNGAGNGNWLTFQLNSDRNIVWASVLGNEDDTIGHEAQIEVVPELGYVISSQFASGGLVDQQSVASILDQSGDELLTITFAFPLLHGLGVTHNGSIWFAGSNGNFDSRALYFVELNLAAFLESTALIQTGSESLLLGFDLTDHGGLLSAVARPHAVKPGHSSIEFLRMDPDATLPACPPAILCPEADARLLFIETSAAERTQFLGTTADTLNVTRTPVVASRFVECEGCTINGKSIGPGTPGSGGITPLLETNNGSCDGSTPREVIVSEGLGGAFSLLLMNANRLDLPFAGGTLYINPANWIILPIFLGGSGPGNGSLTLSDSINLSAAIGLPLYLQLMVADPGASKNVALSNGVEMQIGN